MSRVVVGARDALHNASAGRSRERFAAGIRRRAASALVNAARAHDLGFGGMRARRHRATIRYSSISVADRTLVEDSTWTAGEGAQMRSARVWSRTTIVTAATVLAGSTAVLATTLSAHAAAGCRVKYTVTSQWQGGFGASVDVTTSAIPLTSWRLTWSFTAGQTVTQLWNGTVSQSGSRSRSPTPSWNGDLGAGASTNVRLRRRLEQRVQPGARQLRAQRCRMHRASPPTAPPTAAITTTRVRHERCRPRRPRRRRPAPGAHRRRCEPGHKPAGTAAVQFTWPGIILRGPVPRHRGRPGAQRLATTTTPSRSTGRPWPPW